MSKSFYLSVLKHSTGNSCKVLAVASDINVILKDVIKDKNVIVVRKGITYVMYEGDIAKFDDKDTVVGFPYLEIMKVKNLIKGYNHE
jgi:hypothetical protein